jgi:predicted nucleic acid-binding protein
VYIEFLCGARDGHELALYDAFLKPFLRADGGTVLGVDWQAAERYARQPGRRGRARDLSDCLIRAIADRLRREIITDDRDARRGANR